MHLHTDAFTDRHQRLVADAAARRRRTRPTLLGRLRTTLADVGVGSRRGRTRRPADPGLAPPGVLAPLGPHARDRAWPVGRA